MSETVLVTGAAGNLGGRTVERLAGLGRSVRALSRSPRSAAGAQWYVGDLVSGEGVAESVTGADVIVHCATSGRQDALAAARLVDAAKTAGVPHLLFISIIGVDRHPFSYYRVKYEAERVIEGSGLPYTIMRAAQFHDLLHFALVKAGKVPGLLPVIAGTSFQSVDAGAVADRMAELATGGPAGRVADLAGPRTLTMSEMGRAYLRAVGKRKAVTPVRIPGRVGRAYREGLHLSQAAEVAGIGWEEFLAGSPRVWTPATARPKR